MNGDNQSELLETTSTSSTEDSLNISFEDLKYTVRDGIFSRGRKTILDNMCGSFNAGELTVIMGQSGAGKSTLMDILSGYTKQTSGNIFINGRLRNIKSFRRRSCYILQEDKVQERLTVQESLAIAAELKLGNHIRSEQKKRRVEEIITSLGLGSARGTCAGSLSGGQKKRLAIGLELVNDPAIMFLDEPTSGLDSSISKQIVYLLHLLARQGRTVVVTMHQPSATLLRMVDRLYAVVNGRCAYMGAVSQLVPFLEEMHLRCPQHHNPVDFLIEISVDHAHKLVDSSQNGRNLQWVNNIAKTDDILLEKSDRIFCEDVYLTSLPPPKENPNRKILLALKSTYSTSSWKQFTTLTKRALLEKWRDPSFTLMIAGIHCGMAFFVGTLFYKIGVEAQDVRNNYNFLYFSLMFIMFTAFSAVTINFPEEIPVVRREHFNRWYTTGAYYCSTLASSLPTQTVCTVTYAIIAYFLTGQPYEFIRFSAYCWTLVLVSYVALCLGLVNGSMFNVKNGVIFGPFIVMPFTIFSGFFLRYDDAPVFFRWIFHISFLKHGLVGVVISVFGMERPRLPCPETEDYCHYKLPHQFVKDVGIATERYSLAMAALLGIGFVLIILAHVILKIRLKNKW